MQTTVRQIFGEWDLGYTLDKHVLHSTYVADDEAGRPIFDTVRSEAGEALYRLKYRLDWTQVAPLAEAVATQIAPLLDEIHFVIPIPPSNRRPRQPVVELAAEVASQLGVRTVPTLLRRRPTGVKLKDLKTKEDRVQELNQTLQAIDLLPTPGGWSLLLLDDILDTGASLSTATRLLRRYRKVGKIYAATITWK